MIWILNGKTLATKSNISYNHTPKEHSLIFQIPEYCDNIQGYNIDIFREKLFDNEYVNSLYNNRKLISFDEQNGSCYKLEFRKEVKLDELLWGLEFEVSKVFNKLYGRNAFYPVKSEFNIECISVPRDKFDRIHFEKRYWRKFIDKMMKSVKLAMINPHGKSHSVISRCLQKMI